MLTLILIIIFVMLSLFHFYWMVKPNPQSATLPTVNGIPLFVPSRMTGLAVALAFLAGAFVIWQKYNIPLLFMSLLFLIRAIGEFKYLGFFKKVKESKFAQLDTFFFSPLCLGISIALILIYKGL